MENTKTTNEVMVMTDAQKNTIQEINAMQNMLITSAHNISFDIATKCKLLSESGMKYDTISELTDFTKSYISQMVGVVKIFKDEYNDYPSFTINHFVPLMKVAGSIDWENINDKMTVADIKRYAKFLKGENQNLIESTEETETETKTENETETEIETKTEIEEEVKTNTVVIHSYKEFIELMKTNPTLKKSISEITIKY